MIVNAAEGVYVIYKLLIGLIYLVFVKSGIQIFLLFRGYFAVLTVLVRHGKCFVTILNISLSLSVAHCLKLFRIFISGRICPFTGKKANRANKVSFSNHKTKKLQFVNLQYKKFGGKLGNVLSSYGYQPRP